MATNDGISINITQNTDDNFGLFRIEQENQFDIKIEQDSTNTDIEVDVISGVSGLDVVSHSDEFIGAGTAGNPLALSPEIRGKIDNAQEALQVGPGISIENNVISTTTSYVHEQGVASTTWVIHHNLNKKPVVVVIDSSNNVVKPAVEYNDLNTCTVRTNNAFKGTAYLT